MVVVDPESTEPSQAERVWVDGAPVAAAAGRSPADPEAFAFALDAPTRERLCFCLGRARRTTSVLSGPPREERG